MFRLLFLSMIQQKAFTYPASNLNLTDVLFASSAKAATSDTAVSGEIAQGKAMTLRLNGGGKDILVR